MNIESIRKGSEVALRIQAWVSEYHQLTNIWRRSLAYSQIVLFVLPLKHLWNIQIEITSEELNIQI